MMSTSCMRFKTFIRSVVLGSLMLWLLLAAGANLVDAHSELAGSNPADGASLDEPPDQVSLTFTEELDTSGSSVAVFDQNGQQVDDGNGGVDLNDLDHKTMIVGLPESLAKGAYTVRWTALSAGDGDATTGAIRFTIGGVAPLVQEPTGATNSVATPLLVLLGLIAIVAIVAGAIYIGRKRTIPEKEKVVA